MNNCLSKIIVYGRMIKFGHTIFALPFALSALILAGWEAPLTPWLVFWIIMAMVGARSAAMGFNRLVDVNFDALNPRTSQRELPVGAISAGETKLFIGGASLLFVLSSAMISRECFWLSFPVLSLLLGYSYTKRFTWLSHLILGFVIGLAPLGVWLAVTGEISPPIALLSLALCTYIAGFDILYACQDLEYDRAAGLNSLPVRFGVKKSLLVSAILHVITFLSLLMLSVLFDLSMVYLGYMVIIAILLVVEHLLVKPDNLSRINIAFFHINSIVSVIIFAAILTENILR
ncbi:MAG: UbiA-like polyprenyltransferase [Smithellaceae bacterium]|nr:UbiA-like polyprenyltransferase [Smithellaceae bacterium]